MKRLIDYKSRFRILKGGKISLVVSSFLASTTLAFASPSGGTVTSGNANINQNGATTNITQSTDKASINWQDFSIGKNETVNFIQPSSSSATLNRVVGATPSLVEGAMNANGQVILVNPNGVVFTKGSQVNVGGIVASTQNITDKNFQDGNYVFEGNSENSVINMGTIKAKDGGYVAMIGKTVVNEGSIVATMGRVELAGGNKISLNLNGNSLVKLTIEEGAFNALVENKGIIKADGGQVILTTAALNKVLDGMVNNTGIIEAQGLASVNGVIQLLGDGGEVTNSGKLDVSSLADKGGDVTISADTITLAETSTIDAKGKNGGGNVLVGGDWQGSGDMHQATNVTMAKGARIDASATENGDGGKVVLWSDVSKADGGTVASGTILAKGGSKSGKGGKVETSGAHLAFDEVVVDTQAADGSAGEWLLDPYNFFLNATELNTIASNLNGSNITLTTTSGSTGGANAESFGMGHLVFTDRLDYKGANERTLTLTANKDIWIKDYIASYNNKLNLNFNTSGRVLMNESIFSKGGAVNFNSSAVHFQKPSSGKQLIDTAGGALSFNSANINLLKTYHTVELNTGAGALNLGTGSINQTDTFYDISAPTKLLDGWGGRHPTTKTGSNVNTKSYVYITAGQEYSTRLYLWGTGFSGHMNDVQVGSNANTYFRVYKTGSTLHDIWAPNGTQYQTGVDADQGNTTFVDITFIANHSGQLQTYTNLGPSDWDPGIELYNVWQTGLSSNSGYNSNRLLSLVSTTGQISGSNNISGLSELRVSTDNSASLLTGVISGTGTLVKNGTGTLTLTNNSTYTGATTINAGTLVLQNNAPTKDTSSFSGAGALRIESVGTSFTSPFNTSGWNFGTNLSSLTLGKTTNTTDITIGSTTNIAGPINIYGGNIAINSALSTTGANAITLKGTGTITDDASGYLSASNLLLLGGNVTLDNANNAIGTLAASGVGSLSYTDKDGLIIGTVGSTDGISATGAVSVSTLNGDLSVNKNVSTSNASSSALVLNAGQSTAAGTSTGGNILLAPSTSITVGGGGTAKLYTGSIAGSTALATYLGSGSGRFRYASDETTTGYTKALSTGLNLIYREKPTASVTVANKSMTYGDTLVSLSGVVTGAKNGDEAEYVINGRTNATSGNIKAGSYILDETALASLGYDATVTTNTLIVGTKALSVSDLVVASKEYDANVNATLTTAGTIDTIATDEVTLATVVTFKNKNVETSKLVNLDYTLSGNDASNYTLSDASSVATDAKITAKALTISGITADAKVYNGTTSATIISTNAVKDGLFNGDELALSATGVFVDKNAATGKTVNLTTTYTGADKDNYTIADQETTTATIAKANATVTANSDTSKVYTGLTQTVNGFTASGLVNGEESTVLDGVTAIGSGINAGTYTATASGSDENYNLTFVDGTLSIAKAITAVSGFTAKDKTYDGTTSASLVTTGVNFAGIINSDTLTVASSTGTFEDKNVGTGKNVAISNIVLGGASAGNYSLTSTTADTTASITRLASVEWIGGATGNWFDAANWSDGAVPDFSNVANVIIPTGVVVSFDTTGASAGVSTSAVGIDNLGSLGSMTMTNGALNVTNNITLNTLTQTGGAISGASDVIVKNLTQSGGTIATNALHVSDSFTQGTTGNITVTNNAVINQIAGDMSLGNISTGGTFGATAVNGNIAQVPNSIISTIGAATLNATAGNIVLNSANNDFNTVNASGVNVAIADKDEIELGNITATGTLGVTAATDITQTAGTTITATGETTLASTSGDIKLDSTTNDFSSISASGKDVTLADANGVTLDNITTTGTLGVAAVGTIAQTTNSVINATGATTVASTTGDIQLDGTNNDFSTINASGANVALADRNGMSASLTATGNSALTSGGALNVSGSTKDLTTTTTNGGTTNFGATIVAGALTTTSTIDVTQSGALTIEGTSNIVATGKDVTLNNAANNFKNTVNASGKDVAIKDIDNIALGNITASGTLDVTAEDNITQTAGTTITATGETTVVATNGNITLDSATNDFIGAVSLSGANVSIADANALTLGTTTATSDLTLKSTGDILSLGTTTVGGAFNANSANGNIIQTGPLTVVGVSTIDAGTGKVDLKDPANNMSGGVNVTATSSTVVGDKQGDAAAEALKNANANSAQKIEKVVANITSGAVLSLSASPKGMTPTNPTMSTPLSPTKAPKTEYTSKTIAPQNASGEQQSYTLVGTSEGKSVLQKVSMEELQKDLPQGTEIRVPVGQDSIVEIINGGVKLPDGVSQEFYVVADNDLDKDKK